MKRRDILKKVGAASIGSATIVGLQGQASAASPSVTKTYDHEVGSTDSTRDVEVQVYDPDCSDNTRAAVLDVYADVDDDKLKAETITATFLEERCNSGGCSWVEQFSATAQTSFNNGTSDHQQKGHQLELSDGYSSTNDRFKVKIYAKTEYSDRYYSGVCGNNVCEETVVKSPFSLSC